MCARKARNAAIAAALAALALVMTLVAGCGVSSSGASSAGVARSLQGSTLQGGAFDLAQDRGKPTVVNFFASWCGPCNSEAPDLAAFSAAHPEVAFVGVATNDQPADTQAFVSKYGLTYPIVLDSSGQIGSDWGVTGIPTTFFVDNDGKQRASIVGSATRDQFEQDLKTIQ